MIIGIDIRALQTGHRYRGIGEVTKQVTNRILPLAMKDGHDIIFYEYEGSDPKELLSIPDNLAYEVVKLGLQPEDDTKASNVVKVRRALSQLYGKPIPHSDRSDVFLQFDYAFGVPRDTKTLLIKHDVIPLVFWNKFFESPLVHFKNRAARTMLRTLFANYRFIRILRRGLRNAKSIVTVSESTKRDLVRLLKVPASKISIAHLGVDIRVAKTNGSSAPANLPTKPYVLFVGAGDERRRVDDLVAAFNNLKARGEDIQLVLVGENFKKPSHIPNKVTRDAVLGSSYKSDILTLGYVDDTLKQRLFKGAVAFVYPTRYEGFGIPVLEAFLLETTVVTYRNSSLPEVGGEHAVYVRDWQGIQQAISRLMKESTDDREVRLKSAKLYARNFKWEKTAKNIYRILNS